MIRLLEYLLGAARAFAGMTAAVADNKTALDHIQRTLTTMAIDLSKLQADVATTVTLISDLRSQVSTLQAAAAANPNTDAATQASIDALAATLEAADASPAAAPVVPAAPVAADPAQPAASDAAS